MDQTIKKIHELQKKTVAENPEIFDDLQEIAMCLIDEFYNEQKSLVDEFTKKQEKIIHDAFENHKKENIEAIIKKINE